MKQFLQAVVSISLIETPRRSQTAGWQSFGKAIFDALFANGGVNFRRRFSPFNSKNQKKYFSSDVIQFDWLLILDAEKTLSLMPIKTCWQFDLPSTPQYNS